MGELMKFRLKKGVASHAQNDPETGANRVYESGEVVENERDLAAEMPEKFEPFTLPDSQAAAELRAKRRQARAEQKARAKAGSPAAPTPAPTRPLPAPSFPTPPRSLVGPPQNVQGQPVHTRAELEDMTVPELRSLAAKEDVDLAGARTKDDIVDAILEAQQDND